MNELPYVYADADGDQLAIEPGPHQTARIDAEAGVFVDASAIPAVTNALWRSCGIEPPVMLARPQLVDPDHVTEFRALAVYRSSDGGVSFAIGGNTETLDQVTTRRMAAHAVAVADSPAPAEDHVEELVNVLCDAESENSTPYGVAKALLAAGYARTGQAANA